MQESTVSMFKERFRLQHGHAGLKPGHYNSATLTVNTELIGSHRSWVLGFGGDLSADTGPGRKMQQKASFDDKLNQSPTGKPKQQAGEKSK